MDAELLRELGMIAARQYGLITRAQALAEGANPDSIDYLTKRTWTRVAPGIYRLPGAASSWHQDVVLAILSVADEAVASHQTAAILWKLINRDPYPIHVATTRPRWRRRDF